MRNIKHWLKWLTDGSKNVKFRTKFSGFITGMSSVILALAIASPVLAAPLPSEGYVVGDIFKTDVSAYDANNKDKLTPIMKALVNGKINILCVCFWWCMPCDMLTKLMVGGVGSLNEYVKTERQLLKEVGLKESEIAAYEALHGDNFNVSGADFIRGKYAGWALPDVVFPGNFTASTSYDKNQIHDIELIGFVAFNTGARPSNRFEALGYRTFNGDAKNSLMHSNITAPVNPDDPYASFGPVEAFANKALMGLYQENVVFTNPVISPAFPTEFIMDKNNRIVAIVSGVPGLEAGLVSGNLEDNITGTSRPDQGIYAFVNQLLLNLTGKKSGPLATPVQTINHNIKFVTENVDMFGAAQSAAMLAKLDQASQRLVAGDRAGTAARLQDFWTLLRARLGAHVDPNDNNSPLISSVGEGPSKAYVYTTGTIKQLLDKKATLSVNGMIEAPTRVVGNGTSGSLNFMMGLGYTGNFVANMHGLDGNAQSGSVTNAPDWTNDTQIDTLTKVQNLAGTGVSIYPIVLPVGTLLARHQTSSATTTLNADLDLLLYGPSPSEDLAGGKASPGPIGEIVEIPAVDQLNGTSVVNNFTLAVYGYDMVGAGPASFTLYSSIASTTAPDAGNSTVTAPNAATANTFANVTVNWSGLAAGRSYLGVITYKKDGVIIGNTIIDINTGYTPY